MSPEDNETLTRVGPGTPMGRCLRTHWVPALRSARLVAGGAPVKTRLLGENFVAFRRADGQVGVVDEACPHRGVSLALARNDGQHLQCLFHGWKMDVQGRVAAAPLVPDEARFCAGVATRHHPVVETGNLVWVYLGDGAPPPFPALGFTQDPQAIPRAAIVHCHWLQVQEGTLDPNHVAHLHPQWLPEAAAAVLLNAPPRFEIDEQPHGFSACSLREVAPGLVYARVKEVVLPFAVDIPVDPEADHTTILAVPIDDTTTCLWYVAYADPFAGGPIDLSQRLMKPKGAWEGMTVDDLFWIGVHGDRDTPRNPDNFRDSMPFDPERLWGQDRAAMAQGHHSGLPGLVLEDVAVSESAGACVDRARETLNVTDAFVMRFRRRLLALVHATEAGAGAPSAETDFSRVRARDGLMPAGANWRDLPRFPGEPKLFPPVADRPSA